jgi:hypothetical protein
MTLVQQPGISNYSTPSCTTMFEGFHHQTVHDDASVVNCLLIMMVIFIIAEITILVFFALNSWLPWYNWYTRQTFWWGDDGEHDDEVLPELLDHEEKEEDRNRRIQDSLYEQTWKKTTDDDEDEAKCQDCSICLLNFEINDVVVSSTTQPCDHIFHKTCLRLWLSGHSTCPCCRQEMLVAPQMSTKEDPSLIDEIDDETRISIVPWMTETGELPMSFRDYCLFFFYTLPL